MSDFNCVRYILPKVGKANYAALMKTLDNIYGFANSDAAKFRLKVLEHYYQFGWKSTVHAFNISRGTLYNWKKKFEVGQKRLNCLVPVSTKPKRVRVMMTDFRVVELVVSLRQMEYRLSKYQMKPLVDAWCRELKIAPVGLSTIGKIIKRKTKPRRITKRYYTRKSRKMYLKKPPRQSAPGYIQVDTIHLWMTARKYYFTTVIDVVSKCAWCRVSTHPTSRQALMALLEYQKQDHPLHTVQTDNGSEFLKEFDQYLEAHQLKHEFIYPRSPKINGVVERFNRTLKEEFLNYNDDYFHDLDRFTQKLHRYLEWYNTQRPHQSLKLQTPLSCQEALTSNTPDIPICM